MTKYIKRPIIVEASRWFKPGDHPAVQEVFLCGSIQYVLPHIHTTSKVYEGNWIVGPDENGLYTAYSNHVFTSEFQEYKIKKIKKRKEHGV